MPPSAARRWPASARAGLRRTRRRRWRDRSSVVASSGCRQVSPAASGVPSALRKVQSVARHRLAQRRRWSPARCRVLRHRARHVGHLLGVRSASSDAPSRASAIAGATSSRHGSVPKRACASARPRDRAGNAGGARAEPAVRRRLAAGVEVHVAAGGAAAPSRGSRSPCCCRRRGASTMNPPPPMLPAVGCVTASANATATAASTALPPRCRTATPTSAGVGLGAGDRAAAADRRRPRRRRPPARPRASESARRPTPDRPAPR